MITGDRGLQSENVKEKPKVKGAWLQVQADLPSRPERQSSGPAQDRLDSAERQGSISTPHSLAM